MSDDFEEDFDLDELLEEELYNAKKEAVAKVVQYLRSLANDFRLIEDDEASNDADFVDQLADVFDDPSWLKV